MVPTNLENTPQLLRMPNASVGTPPKDQVEHCGQVVVVGANGSGKSRLGAWLENPASLMQDRGMHGPGPREAYRVGAQRILSLPDQAQRVDPARAADQLLRGSEGPGTDTSRVQGDPVVGQNNDFLLLLNSLFAERARLDREYRELGAATAGNPGVPPQDTIQRLGRLWGRIFPERELIIGDHIIQAKPMGDGAAYRASALSDGERVGFYLTGHVLLAPGHATIVIDEPELHLHESIQSTLWDALEAERKDCVFVYITHDLGFAASRVRATKVVLFDYAAPITQGDVGHWIWAVVPRTEDIPEDVVLRILGSRRPTLFVEGLVGSLDQMVYEALYPDKYIVPCGNAESVDRAVRAFRQRATLHHLEVAGIMDRDDQTEAEVESREKKSVFVLPVAAVENLLALPACIEAFAKSAGTPEAELAELMRNGQDRVILAMTRVREDCVAVRARYAVRRRLRHLTPIGPTKADLVAAVDEAVKHANPGVSFDEAQAAVEGALSSGDRAEIYEATLRIFRNKAVLPELATALRVSPDVYSARVIDALREDPALRGAVRALMPIDRAPREQT